MSSQANSICLSCTLCCNGALFADLRLSPADQARLKRKSIALKLTRSGKLPQPCQALCGPKCTLYASRPDYCRRFECLLLKKCNTGQVSPELALKVIRTARRRLAKAEKLFQALGDHDQVVAISVRFRRLACSIESSRRDARASAMFGDLSLAMHDLNHFFSEHFYR